MRVRMGIAAGADLRHFLNATRTPSSALHVARRLGRHLLDMAMHRRGMQLVSGNALAARLLRSAADLGVDLREETRAIRLLKQGRQVTGAVLRGPFGEYGIAARCGVVLAAEDRTERIALPVSLEDARLQLRTLDEDVQQSLMRLSRDERTVYLTVGHGELNDQSSARATDTLAISSGTFAVSSLLGYLNYAQRELGVRAGLGNEVPQDAAMVLVLGWKICDIEGPSPPWPVTSGVPVSSRLGSL